MAATNNINNSSDNLDLSGDKKSESSRLISSNSNSSTSNLYLCINACAVIFLCIIIYCCIKDGITLFSFHPIFMTSGWLVLMTTAINSISPGDIATEWMPIRLRSARHWVIQVIGASVSLMGSLFIVANKIINDKPHFATWHSKFGLVSMVLMVITMMGGVCTLYSLQLKEYLAPIYTKLSHATLGLVTFIFGMTTIILALFSSWWSFGDVLRYSGLILVCIVTLLTILKPSLKVFFRLSERLSNTY